MLKNVLYISFIRRYLFILLLPLVTVKVQSQVANYTFTKSSNTYSAIGGTAIAFVPPGVATAWDNGTTTTALTIPFTYTFNGTGYTTVFVNSNGYVSFSVNSNGGNFFPISGTGAGYTYAGAISGFGTDITNNGVAATYTTLGSAPNRIFVIQWSSARRRIAPGVGGTVQADNINFQIRLYETTNAAEVMYGTCTFSATLGTCQVGLRGASNADFNNVSTSTDWTNPTNGGTNTNASTMTSSSTVGPASGQTYTWTNGCSGTPTGGTAGSSSSSVCSGSTVTLSLSGNTSSPGITYQWQSSPAGAGTWTDISGATSTSVTSPAITANTDFRCNVTCTNSSSTSASSTTTVNVTNIPATPGSISGSGAVCENTGGNAYSISAVTGATSYTWSYSGTGATITNGTTTNPTIAFAFGATSGTLSVTATNSCGTSAASTMPITINSQPANPGAILGDNPACAGASTIYSVTDAGLIYTWAVPAGWTITAGQGTSTLTVTPGASGGNLSVTGDNGTCSSTASSTTVTVTNGVPGQPGAIIGNSDICQGSVQTYSVTNVAGVTYTWAVPAGWVINFGQNTNSINVTAGSTSGNVQVTPSNVCGNGTSQTLAVTVTTSVPAQPSAISGNITVCQGSSQTYSVTNDPNVTTYTWSVPVGWTINSGQGSNSVSVTVGAAGGNVLVTPSNSCGNGSAQTEAITVNTLPGSPGSITGATDVCQGSTQTYSVTNVAGITYTWSFPAGWTIVSGQGTNSIDVTVGAASGNVQVTPSNLCGSGSAQTLGITVSAGVPAQPGAITGNTSVCQGSSQIYSVTNVAGVTYTWVVPAGSTITGGQGTNSITVTIGASSGNVQVTPSNVCGDGTAQIASVSVTAGVPGQPGAITGNPSVCQGSSETYSVTNVVGVTYTWTVPAGSTITAGQGTNSITVTIGANSGNVQVTPSNVCGNGTARSTSVTVSTGVPAQPGAITGNTTVCQGSSQTYSVTGTAGVTYTWAVPAGWSITVGQGTNSITATVGASGGSIQVTPSNACGNGTAQTLSISVNTGVPSQPSAITGAASVCQGSSQTYSVTNVAGVTYTWAAPAGWTITAGQGTNSITATVGASSGNIQVTPSNSCGNGIAQTLAVTVTSGAPAQPSTITGNTTVCLGSSQTYSVTNVAGVTYTWAVPGGWAITSGQGTSSITATAGATSGVISVTPSNVCGNGTARGLAVTVTNSVPAQPGAITGNASICQNTTQTYSVTNVAGVTYTWAVPAGWVINSGQTTNSINVTAGSASGNVQVTPSNVCGNGTAQTLAVAVSTSVPSQPGAISGNTIICQGSTQTYSVTNVAGVIYTWTVPGGWAINSGQNTNSISVTAGAAGGNVQVTPSNSCGSGTAQTLAITVNTAVPAQPGTITGNTTVCQSSSQIYSVTNVAGVTYTWVVPGGWIINSGQGTNSVSVTAGAVGGTIQVTPSNSCGSGTARTQAVSVNTSVPAQPSAISGNAAVCQGSSQTYSVTNVAGVTYTWSVPGGWTINSGQTTNTITVTVGASSGTIQVTPSNSCGNGTAQTLAVTVTAGVPSQPSAISGNTTICQGSSQTYSVANVAGVTYTWSGPAGWTVSSGQGTNTVTFTVGAGSGNIQVVPSNVCGNGTAATLAVTVNGSVPSQPGSITGNTNICQGSSQTYSVTNVAGVTYTWTVPAGSTITSGQGTNSITVTIGANSGNIQVTPSNACGNGTPQTLGITVTAGVPAQPGAISGNTVFCQGTTQTYSVTNVAGVTYTWSAPAGWTLNSGQGTNTVTFTAGGNSGNIQVAPSNICGTGVSRFLAVTVNPQPITTATNKNQTMCSGDSISTILISSSNVLPGTTFSYSWTSTGAITSSIPVSGTSLPDNTTIDGTFTNNTLLTDTVTFTISSTGANGCAGTVVTATIIVGPASFVITQQPSDAAVCEGQSATFTVAATPGPTYRYQWYVSTDGGTTWNAISGATLPAGVYSNYTTATLVLSAPPASMDGYQYLCRVAALPCGAAVSRYNPGALLSVNSNPLISVSPTTANNCGATGVTLTASGAGTGGTYSWSPVTGLSATTGASVISNPINPPVGTIVYTVTGTTAKGCSATGTTTVNTALSGTYTVGAASTFATTLTSAVQKAVTLGLCGPTTFLLTDANYTTGTGETFPITLNAIPGSSSTNTLTIKPATGTNPTITGSASNVALFNIYASNVILDGSNVTGGTTRNLTINNTAGEGNFPTVILLGSVGTQPITSTTVKNCVIIDGNNYDFTYDAANYGSRGTTGIMVAAAGSTYQPDGGYFNNLVIQNNDIRKAVSGVWARAAAGAGTGTGLNVTGNVMNTAGTTHGNSIGLYGVYTRDVTGVTVQNNDIGNYSSSFNRGSYPFVAAVWFASGTVNTVVTGNTIHDISFLAAGGAGAPSGVYITPVTNGTDYLSQNTIKNLSAAGNANCSAIYIPGFPSAGITLEKNQISNIKNTAGESRAIWLENNSASSTTVVDDNFIWDVAGSSNSYGIYLDGSGTFNVYFNSININNISAPNPGATGTSAAIRVEGSSSNSLNIRDNIFANNLATGTRYAFYSNVASGSYTNIDYNDYYVPTGNIGFLGGNRATIAAWQAATGRDVNSLNSDPSFTSTTNLHITAASAMSGAGVAISGIVDDIDGDTRPATPSCGADENNVPPTCYRPTDLGANNIVYNGANLFWTAPVSGSPAQYIWEVHTGIGIGTPIATSGTTAAPATNATATGLTENTVYYLYVRTNCGGTNNSIWSGPYAFQTPYQPLCGIYHVGIAQASPFNTLTNAITRLNLAGVSCAVTFLLDDATYSVNETFPITIDPIKGGSFTNTFTIKPNTGVSPTITGSVNGALINLNGCQYTTIDGSNGSANNSKNLTIINTNTGTSAITLQLTNDASYDTVRNNIIQGATTAAGLGVITINGATTTGNNYNYITNNDITKTSGASPTVGINNQGSSGKPNTSNTISRNRLFDFSLAGIVDEGYSSNTLIKGNEIYLSAATNGDKHGIWLQASTISGVIISANNIHDLKVANTSGIYGINLQGATSCTIYNNFINLNDNNATPMEGIWDQLGAGSSVGIYYNTIVINGTVASGANKTSEAYLKSSTGTTTLKDNILVNNRSGGTGKSYAIRYNATSGLTSNYNDIYNGGGTNNVLANNGAGAGTDQATLVLWRSATSQDLNSLNVLPLFVSTSDLHLDPASNASLDNMGTPALAITLVDYDYDTRSTTTPDMGADEFGVTISTQRYWSGTDNWDLSNINWSIQTGGPYITAPWVKDYTANLENTSGTITTTAAVRAIAINEGTTPYGSNLTYTIKPSAASNYLTLTSSGLINIASGSTLNIGVSAGPAELYGTVGLIKKGGGLLALNYQTDAAFSGLIQVTDGTLQLNAPTANTLPTGSNIDITGGATLKISRSQTLNNINLYSGSITIDAGQVLTINGTLTIVSGTITGPGTILYNAGSKLIYAGNVQQTTGIEALPSTNLKSVVFNNGSWGGVNVTTNLTVATADSINGWVDMTGGGTGSYIITGAGTSYASGLNTITKNASFSSGSTTLSLANTTGISLGMKVTGLNIASETYVTYVSGTVVNISAATTGTTGLGVTPITFSIRGGLVINHAGGVSQAVAVAGAKGYSSGMRYRFTTPSGGVIYPAFPTGVDSSYDITLQTGTSNRVVLGESSNMTVTDSLTLTTGILVTNTSLLTWANNAGGALTAPEASYTANSTNYTKSFIATSDASGVPLSAAGATTAFAGNVGFRIKNVAMNKPTYFPVGPSYLTAMTGQVPSPNRMMIDNQSGSPQDFTVLVNYGDVGYTNLGAGTARVNRIWYVKSNAGKATMQLFFTKRDWTGWLTTENEVETGFNYALPALVEKDYSGDQNGFINLSNGGDIKDFTSVASYPYNTEIYGVYSINTSNNQTNGIEQFYRFSVVNPGNIILPVTTINLRAYQKGTGIQVDWSALNESGVDHYEVEKSTNAVSFTMIGKVNAKNNAPVINYGLTDPSPATGSNYYRIKTVSANGEVKYTMVVVVNIGNTKTFVKVYPNPVQNGILHLQLNNLPAGRYQLVLYNLNGQLVFTHVIDHPGGSSTETILLPPNLATATYMARFFDANKNFNNKLIIK